MSPASICGEGSLMRHLVHIFYYFELKTTRIDLQKDNCSYLIPKPSHLGMFEKADGIYCHALGDKHQVRPYTFSSAFEVHV
jgi:hypothetical protein